MIPFSFFIVVPGAEALLPAYLKIFPNSLPSQFITETDRKNTFQRLKKQQKEAAEKLLVIWPNYLNKLVQDPKVNEHDKV